MKQHSTSELEKNSNSTLIEICMRQENEIHSLNEKLHSLQSRNQESTEGELTLLMDSYSVEKLKLLEEKEVFEFFEFAKNLITKMQRIFEWYNPISDFLNSPQLLTIKQRQIVEKQIENIRIRIEKTKTLQDTITKVQPLLLEYKSSISNIENEERSLIELLSQKENLESRRYELELLRKQIEENKLIELKNEIDNISLELFPKEKEYNEVRDQIESLLKSKTELEEKLNETIAVKLFLTNVPELILKIEKEINEYQEKHLENCKNQIEECKIKIDFAKITSSELLNNEDLTNLDSIQKRLNEIDERIKERLQTQK